MPKNAITPNLNKYKNKHIEIEKAITRFIKPEIEFLLIPDAQNPLI